MADGEVVAFLSQGRRTRRRALAGRARRCAAGTWRHRRVQSRFAAARLFAVGPPIGRGGSGVSRPTRGQTRVAGSHRGDGAVRATDLLSLQQREFRGRSPPLRPKPVPENGLRRGSRGGGGGCSSRGRRWSTSRPRECFTRMSHGCSQDFRRHAQDARLMRVLFGFRNRDSWRACVPAWLEQWSLDRRWLAAHWPRLGAVEGGCVCTAPSPLPDPRPALGLRRGASESTGFPRSVARSPRGKALQQIPIAQRLGQGDLADQPGSEISDADSGTGSWFLASMGAETALFGSSGVESGLPGLARIPLASTG